MAAWKQAGRRSAAARVWAWACFVACLWRGSWAQVAPCSFNLMCTCRYAADAPSAAYTTSQDLEHVTEVTCVGVPFARIPGQLQVTCP